MRATLRSLTGALRAARTNGVPDLAIRARNGWWSDTLAYGLRRDLSKPHTPPEPRIPIAVHELESGDIGPLFDEIPDATNSQEVENRRNRRKMLGAGIGICFVAVADENQPVYVQWLITAEDNGRLRSFSGGLFPSLEKDEVLLENAFMLEAYRGKRIMPWAMYHVSQRGVALGARSALTFVGSDNIASLKGCTRAGFVPYIQRRQQWRGYRHRVCFEPLPGPVVI